MYKKTQAVFRLETDKSSKPGVTHKFLEIYMENIEGAENVREFC